MALDWFSKAGSSDSVADLVARKKYGKALEKLRAEFDKGNRSVGLRLQYADVLALADQTDQAIPVLLGLASELHAAGVTTRALEILQQAEKLGPARPDVGAKRRAFTAAAQRRAADEAAAAAPKGKDVPPSPPATAASSEPPAEAASGDAGPNDALDLFGPALAPPSLRSAAPSAAQVAAALAHAEATIASDLWVDVDGEAPPDVLVAEMASEPSIADIAEMAVAEGHSGKGSLLTYIRDLAAHFPVPAEERPGLHNLAAALFDGLDDDELREQLPGLRRRDFDPGSAMVREGDKGRSLFVLARGRARVTVQGAHGGAFEVAELFEGAFFGEISMVGGQRTATVEAIGPCETLEIATPVVEALAQKRPLAQELVEQTLLDRAGSIEMEAVRAIPAMDEATPARALALFDAHFGQKAWNPKMRVRLADLLARSGHYIDVVPLLVGLADQMQAAGQPARALAMLGKIASLGIRASRELRMPALTREPATPRPGPLNTILTYVAHGRPAPTPKAAQHFGLWLHQLMGEARVEEPRPQAADEAGREVDLMGVIDLDEFSVDLAKPAAQAQGDTRKGAKASPVKRPKASGHSHIR